MMQAFTKTTSPLKGEASQWWALSDLNGRPFGCKPNALTAELSAQPILLHRTGRGAKRQRGVANGSFLPANLFFLEGLIAESHSSPRRQTRGKGRVFAEIRVVPCTLCGVPVNSFSCSYAKETHRDADCPGLRGAHGQGSGETPGGRRPH